MAEPVFMKTSEKNGQVLQVAEQQAYSDVKGLNRPINQLVNNLMTRLDICSRKIYRTKRDGVKLKNILGEISR